MKFIKRFVLYIPILLLFTACLGADPQQYDDKPVASNLPPLTILPQNPQVIQGQNLRFNGQGGYISDTGYIYSLVGLGGNAPPGSIDPYTGIYTAPGTVNPNNSVAFVIVTDATGNSASTTVLNIASMEITPSSQVVTVGKKANFDVIGGQPPISWCVVDTVSSMCLADANVGSITSTGLFASKTTSGTTTIQAIDATGNAAQAVVIIQALPDAFPKGISVPYGWTMQITVQGGTAPFTYSLDGSSVSYGGSITTDGIFTAPNQTGNSTVTVNDFYTASTTTTLSIINPNVVSAGKDFNCLLYPDTQSVKCWGDNTNYQTGYPSTFVNDGYFGSNNFLGDETNELGSRVPILKLNNGAFINAQSVVSGLKHACVLDAGYNIRCWGTNEYGQFGVSTGYGAGVYIADASDSSAGAKVATYVTSTNYLADMLASGANHVCARSKNDTTGKTINCWGKNDYAQLGVGNTTSPVVRPTNAAPSNIVFAKKVIDIKLGANHSCVLLESTGGADVNEVRCWGDNQFGQLGQNTTTTVYGDSGAEATDLIAASSASVVAFANPGPNLATGATLMPLKLTVGANHTCALLNDNTVRCWGDNSQGQLGRGSVVAFDWDPGNAIDLNSQYIIKVIAGFTKTCFILLGGYLECVGDNVSGSLGIGVPFGTAALKGQSASDMGANLANVDADLSGYVTDASIGQTHVCAVLNDNRVKCWGDASKGQIGTNNNTSKGSSAADMGANLSTMGLF